MVTITMGHWRHKTMTTYLFIFFYGVNPFLFFFLLLPPPLPPRMYVQDRTG